MRLRPSHLAATALTGLLTLLATCTGEPPAEVPAGSTGAPADAPDSPPAADGTLRTYERNVVLLSLDADSLLAVAWLFTAQPDSTSVARAARAFVLHDVTWETVFEDAWEGPVIREPWRVLPHGGLRVLVGLGDILDRIVLEGPDTHAELVLGDVLSEWSGPRGGTYHLLEGQVVLGDRKVDGLGLDMARSWTEDDRHGDWAFLVSGDSLQVVLHSPTLRPPGSGAWRGWARLDFRQLQWPVLTMQWPDLRAFEQARRDVPVAWGVLAPDGEVTVELSAAGAHLETDEGEGAQLPVRGLFGVVGTLSFEGGLYPVRGLLRHVQP
jgi:hypothetical protein